MHFCSNCGKQIDDSLQFCPGCGSKQIPASSQPQQPQQPQTQQQYQQPPFGQPQYQQVPPQQPIPPRPINLSNWDGSVLDTIVNSIVASLIITFTCGIATPWAICYMYKFIINHVIVDGRRLKFTGDGGSLFANWIKWFLLIIITCGIYSFWVTPRLYQWIAQHTHFE